MPGRRRRPEGQRTSPASIRYHKPLPPLRRSPQPRPGATATWVSSRPLKDGPTALKLLGVDLSASEAFLQDPDGLPGTRSEPGHGPHPEADQSSNNQETGEPHPPAHAEHRAHLTAQRDPPPSALPLLRVSTLSPTAVPYQLDRSSTRWISSVKSS